MRQSVNLQLFNYLYTKFEELGVPIIRTSELNQALPYPSSLFNLLEMIYTV